MCNLSEGVWDEGVKHGQKIGIAQGRIEGEKLASIDLARNLIQKTNMNDQEISDLVSNSVTPEEVEKLRSKIHLS